MEWRAAAAAYARRGGGAFDRDDVDVAAFLAPALRGALVACCRDDGAVARRETAARERWTRLTAAAARAAARKRPGLGTDGVDNNSEGVAEEGDAPGLELASAEPSVRRFQLLAPGARRVAVAAAAADAARDVAVDWSLHRVESGLPLPATATAYGRPGRISYVRSHGREFAYDGRSRSQPRRRRRPVSLDALKNDGDRYAKGEAVETASMEADDLDVVDDDDGFCVVREGPNAGDRVAFVDDVDSAERHRSPSVILYGLR